jgi:hypothetical protein
LRHKRETNSKTQGSIHLSDELPVLAHKRLSMNGMNLAGKVSEISRSGLYADHQERVTLLVQGAEPLYAELRVPNEHRWGIGQKVVVTIIATESEGGKRNT